MLRPSLVLLNGLAAADPPDDAVPVALPLPDAELQRGPPHGLLGIVAEDFAEAFVGLADSAVLEGADEDRQGADAEDPLVLLVGLPELLLGLPLPLEQGRHVEARLAVHRAAGVAHRHDLGSPLGQEAGGVAADVAEPLDRDGRPLELDVVRLAGPEQRVEA